MIKLSRVSHRNRGPCAPASHVDSPAITIITPAYNVDQYIDEAVRSVLGQTFTNFQYVVINDGSTDETAAEVIKHAEKDRRLELINTDNLGASHARNVGLDQAKGQYIAFLDGDDRWHPEFLESQLALLESAGPDVAAVFARSRVMSAQGRVYYRHWQRAGRFDFDDMLIQACPPRTGSSLLIRKQAFDSAGPFDVDLNSGQDFEMWLRIQSESHMPYFVGNSRYLLDIRIRPGAISRDYKKRFIALDSVIQRNCTNLRRHPKGMGYVRAAVFAYRVGEDDFAERWARLARNDSLPHLLIDLWGWRLLTWSVLSRRQRRVLRRSRMLARSLAGWALGVSGGALR